MMFFFGTAAAGGAPALPSIVVSRNGNTSSTVSYTFPSGYDMGKGASFGESRNQFCNINGSCLPYGAGENLSIFQMPLSFSNTAGPLQPNLVYWNVQVTNQYGKTAVYRTVAI